MATKSTLIETLVEKHGLSKKEATKYVGTLIDGIHDIFVSGEPLLITGLGTFKVRNRAARKGRNPQSGEPLEIKESKVIAFKNSDMLKGDLNK